MTKEELATEAKEWCKKKNLTSSNVGYFTADYCEQSYIAGAEPREKRIAELEKENAELLGIIQGKDKAIQELEKENKVLAQNLEDTEIINAELKEKLNFSTQYYQGEKAKEQLTKAKELLEKLLFVSCNSDVLNQYPNCSEVLRVRVEAEQFLSEVEK